MLFTAAAASNDANEKITPVAGKPKITPVAGEPRTPLLSKPISNQNSIIPNKNKDKEPALLSFLGPARVLDFKYVFPPERF